MLKNNVGAEVKGLVKQSNLVKIFLNNTLRE